MARRVLAFECQYCGAIRKSKNIAERHEATCKHNPNPKNCLLCIHSQKQQQRVPGGGWYLCSVRQVACSSAVSAHCAFFRRKEEENNG